VSVRLVTSATARTAFENLRGSNSSFGKSMPEIEFIAAIFAEPCEVR
jgi:hypothetical protein